MTHVFTYGSLMYPEVFERVALTHARRETARLEGWKRHAIRGATYPAAVPSEPDVIQGVVWLDIGDEPMRRLDRFEGDEYRRETVLVHLPDNVSVIAEIYRWLDPGLLLPHDWSELEFERLHLADFYQIHGG